MLTPTVDTCGECLKPFGVLDDHPKKDGKNRCPHCLAIGLDKEREKSPIPTLIVTLRDDHKMKESSVEATVDHRQEISLPHLGGYGSVEYNFTGFGATAKEATESLVELTTAAGISQILINEVDVKSIDDDIEKRKYLSTFR